MKHVAFIHYTSVCSSSDDVQLSKSMGADNYLIKPVSTQVLLRTLEEARRNALESAPVAPSDRATQLMQEIMVLTKMNWNSANFSGLWPITLRFSRLVGDVLREVGDREPEPKYKFYM